MYRSILYTVIYIVVLLVLTTVNCLKIHKREEDGGVSKKSLKTTAAKATPITYETDPAVLERERRQKIAENRERMRKKREKKTNKIVEAQRKLKEEKMLSEDSTQPMNSDESLEQSKPSEEILEPEKVGKTEQNVKPVVPEKQERTVFPKNEEKLQPKSSNSGSNSTEEDLGEVKLVDEDPYAAAKKHIIKKRAQELARKKQHEENVRKRLDRENCSNLASPDDTLKNITSIQYESQLSMIQRKRRQSCSKDSAASGESQEGTCVEAKSNELYIQDILERVMQ